MRHTGRIQPSTQRRSHHTRVSPRKTSVKSIKHNVKSINKRTFSSNKDYTDPSHDSGLPSGDGAFTSKSLYDCDPEMTYGGALSFLRRKYSRNVKGHGEDGNERADVVVSGLPYDGAVTYRSGARLGPRAIRSGSVQLAELKPYPWGFNPFDHLGVIDAGDAFIDPHNPMSVRDTIVRHARKYIQSIDGDNKAIKGQDGTYGNFLTPGHAQRPPRLLTFGGDHFVTYPLLQAHAEKYGPMALLHFDAHCDTWEVEGSDNTEVNHGTMFRHAAKEGIIIPESSIQVGLRTINDDYCGFNVLDATWVHNNGTQAVLDKIKNIIGKSGLPVYLTFDIDCLDPAHAPGTGTPVPGGLTSFQALHILRNLRDTGIDIVGADVVEVSPAYDVSELTGLAAAHVATDILCHWANEQRHAGIQRGQKM